jgi:hypothetical protein
VKIVRTVRRWIALTGVLLVLLLGIAWFVTAKLPKVLVTRHMISVTRELKSWGQEYSTVKNDKDAFRAIEILEYVSGYYVPGEGYRGPEEIEATLEKQRSESMGMLVAALEKHSGESYGTNQSRWYQWAEGKGYRRTH